MIEPICTTEELGHIGWDDPLKTTAFGTTGLKMDDAVNYMDRYDYDKEIKPFLQRLNYGNYKEEVYDCDDQALWGLAHLRHMFPGVPSAIASGKTVEKEPHALIIIWYRGRGGGIEKAFFDPRNKDLVDFGEIFSVVAYPPSDKPENTSPVVKGLEGKMLVYDRKRAIYAKNTIINYLSTADYETRCDDIKNHSIKDEEYFERLWLKSAPDRALWAMAHIHRDLIGCPVGVAKGTKAGSNSTSWVVIFYYKENDNPKKKLTYAYYDPHPRNPKEIASDQFTSKMIFM